MICQEVLVGDPCDLVIPSFTIEGEEGSFQFTNTSQGQIDDIRYDFGDGIFSNNPNPFHIYQETGDFTVCIQVTQDEYNCIKEFCDKGYRDFAPRCLPYHLPRSNGPRSVLHGLETRQRTIG